MATTIAPSAGIDEGGTYPKLKKVKLEIEVQIENADKDEYVYESPNAIGEAGEALQLGFIADLFDLFNFEASLGVTRINGETPETIRQKLP